MSRIGTQPVKIEDKVSLSMDGRVIHVKGPKGELVLDIPWELEVVMGDGYVQVKRKSDEKRVKSLHGTYRSLIANAVEGVSRGFSKTLEIVGVGYRAKMEGQNISISLGWTHPVIVEAHEGIKFEVPDETTIIVSGIDKQLVGEVAAKIRSLRKPEPYKGKGIRYKGEYVRRKSAKSVVA